jgi:hypothetical protein
MRAMNVRRHVTVPKLSYYYNYRACMGKYGTWCDAFNMGYTHLLV